MTRNSEKNDSSVVKIAAIEIEETFLALLFHGDDYILD